MQDFVGKRVLARAALKQLAQPSDRAGLIQLGSQLAALAVSTTGLAITWGSWWALPFFVAQGVLLNFLYAGQHEFSHWTVFRRKSWNDACGRVIGFLVFYPRDYDRVMHFTHHRFTQDWQRDGELVTRVPYTFSSYLIYLLGPAYWYFRMRRILRHAFGQAPEPFLSAETRPVVIREARGHVLGYALILAASLATQSWAAVIFWLAPMLALKWVHNLQNTIEHLGLSHEADTLANTRTVRTNALMRWLCWNMQYHTAHHTYPGVPFHRLPELHQAIVASTGRQPPTMGYLRFQWEVLTKLARAKSEADFADRVVWIEDEEGAFDARRAAA